MPGTRKRSPFGGARGYRGNREAGKRHINFIARAVHSRFNPPQTNIRERLDAASAAAETAILDAYSDGFDHGLDAAIDILGEHRLHSALPKETQRGKVKD